MFLWRWLALVAFLPVIFSTNAGVKVQLTQKGLEYGRQIGMATLQQKLKTISIPDMSGKERVSGIGKVRYSLTGMRIVNLGLSESALGLVPGTGVSLSITNAFLSLHGNWRVKYLRFIKDRGSFDVGLNGLTITASISVKSDAMGRPEISAVQCAASVGSVRVKFHHGASWLYNLFRKFVEKALRKELQKQICPLVVDAVSDMNPSLKTLNVLAKVDKYAEIEYSMVASPEISTSAITLGLKGEFYNIGQHQEPPFSPAPFSIPAQGDNMLYIGMSAFTANSAAFVYNKAGILSLDVTDDMIPKISPIRLNTRTFGVFIPQIAKRFPGLMMKMQVKMARDPVITFASNKMTLQATAMATAYAIQPNATLSPLFVLNLDTSVSTRVSVTGMNLAASLTLNKLDMTVAESYVGDFQVGSLNNIIEMVLKLVVIPIANVQLQKGYPLPALGKMKLVNPQIQFLEGYMLIGTDVQFTG